MPSDSAEIRGLMTAQRDWDSADRTYPARLLREAAALIEQAEDGQALAAATVKLGEAMYEVEGLQEIARRLP